MEETEIHQLCDGLFEIHREDAVKTIDESKVAEFEKKYKSSRIKVALNPLLVVSGNKKILIDCGFGTKREHFIIHRTEENNAFPSLQHSLQICGIDSGEITDVILTHLHYDHVGGATETKNGHIQATFPNAVYHVQQDEIDYALNPPEELKWAYHQDDFVPLLNDQKVKIYNGNWSFSESIKCIQTGAHTPGHQIVWIQNYPQISCFLADLFPTYNALFNEPFGEFNSDPSKIEAWKSQLIPQFAEQQIELFFYHAPKLKHGKIVRNDDGSGYRFEQIV